MQNKLFNTDIISIKNLSIENIKLILKTAMSFQKQPNQEILKNKIIANCFFEPSTRTRLSFETAALSLGGKIIGFSDPESTSTKKGENLSDTIRVIASYADLIIIRHPKEGAARLAAEVSDKPVINAGDAANQHPTQALTDLFTMQACQGKLEKLNIAVVGDLKYGRTVHSLLQACALFDMRVFLIAPEALTLPEQDTDFLKKAGIRFSFHDNIEEIIHRVDIIYMTRIQQERFDHQLYQQLKDRYIITHAMLKNVKSNLKIFHPLPRLNEIAREIDNTAYAYYFNQAANGVCVRQALLKLLLVD